MDRIADLQLAPPAAAALCGGGARGALNDTAIAAGMSASELIDLWSSIGRKNIVAPNWTTWLRPWTCAGPYTLNPPGRRLRAVLPVSRFERLVIPLTPSSPPSGRRTGSTSAI